MMGAAGFMSVNGTPRNRLARLYADGTLDVSFDRRDFDYRFRNGDRPIPDAFVP